MSLTQQAAVYNNQTVSLVNRLKARCFGSFLLVFLRVRVDQEEKGEHLVTAGGGGSLGGR